MMPNSHTRQIVSNHNGQKRINLRAALETQQHKTSSVEMTFGELARAYLAVHYNGADMQLSCWVIKYFRFRAILKRSVVPLWKKLYSLIGKYEFRPL